MKKLALILIAVMVILASLNLANSTPVISSSVYEILNQSKWCNVGIIVNTPEALDEVIAILPESEFQFEQKRNSYLPYFVGNITREGLDILANNSNVSQVIYNIGASLASDNPTNITIPVFIDPKVPAALENLEWVYVGVSIKDTSGIYIDPSLSREEKFALTQEIKDHLKIIREQIVSNLSVDEFNTTRLSLSGFHFNGYITKKGLEKLSNSPYIRSIVIPLQGGSPSQEAENQTLPYVDPEILKAFENQTWVDVIVRTIDISNITINLDDPVEKRYRDIQRQEAILSNFSDTIIANLPPEGLRSVAELSNGFGAFITKEVFDILANDSRITRIYYSTPIYGASNPKPYIDPAVITAFEQNQTWVDVYVVIVDISNITFQGTKEERRVLVDQKNAVLRIALENILENYSERELNMIYKSNGDFDASITKEGLDKLSNDFRIKEIHLEYKGTGYASSDNQNISLQQPNKIENQTQIKTPSQLKSKTFFQNIIDFFKALFGWK
ncbi:MAG: hypothetical protein NTX01_03045 [Candidatus Omnitrophica bacterium]|nr:hypothetical protein [Candidatus Omnitrophota bacterium]